MTKRAVRVLLAALTASFVAGALLTSAAAAPAAPQPREQSLVWGPCAVEAAPAPVQCATFEVPQDWAGSTGGTTYTQVAARIQASGGKRIGVLVFNPGGPGGSGVDAIKRVHARLPEPIKQSFDLVTWDPRGVGQSEPSLTECPPADTPTPPVTGSVDWAAYTSAYMAALATHNAQCLAANPVDAQYVGTWQVVRDLDALRAALGESRITFWGMSYGTTVGRAYAQAFPARLRALLLDGAISPDPSIMSYAREHIWDDGQAVATMIGAFGAEAARTYLEANRYLNERVLVGENPGESIDRWSFNTTLASTSAYQSTWPDVQELIRSVRTLLRQQRPDPARVSAIARSMEQLPEEAPLPVRADGVNPLFQFVNCADMQDRPTSEHLASVVEQAAGVSGVVYGIFALGEGSQCSGLPILGRPLAGLDTPLRLDPPAVIVNSVSDNRTPWFGARQTANLFTRSAMVTYAGTQHVSYSRVGPCVDNAITPFLVDLRRPARSVGCPLIYRAPRA